MIIFNLLHINILLLLHKVACKKSLWFVVSIIFINCMYIIYYICINCTVNWTIIYTVWELF